MPTEKLLIFDELGNAKRVKARLTRFLENEPVTNTEKSAMRDTLGISGTSGDLLAANNLSDVASKDTAKLNLEIPDIGLQANQAPLSGMLGDLAFQSSEGTTLATLKLTDLPTSASGLASGTVWNDSGTLKIVS
jgi:predicted component of type VI protein secretion system